MHEQNKKILEEIFLYNPKTYNILKCAEELQELSLELIRTVTKPIIGPERIQAIVDEIGDVEIRFKILKKHFDKDQINERIQLKINKFELLLKTKKYVTV